jgi:hypothetical protein
MDGKPKRRWLRFSLSTLLIGVTIFCMWLGWQVSIVRERRALGELVDFEFCECMPYLLTPYDPPNFNFVRRMMGDAPLYTVHCYDDIEPALLDRIKRAYPEAIVRTFRRPNEDELIIY